MHPPLDPRRIELLDPEVVAMLKAKSPAEKLGMAFEMQNLARRVLFSRIRSQHPEWTQPEIDDAVAQRMNRGER
ncbi:MAG: hypothetical protein JWP89_2029 [Schlesneria sp.]|nr:hypothetical protein [Schlesneria sp.]